jgi:hypothetical protein
MRDRSPRRTIEVCPLAEGQTNAILESRRHSIRGSGLGHANVDATQSDDCVESAYELCHDTCVMAHKCLDQIVPSFSQQRADDVRTRQRHAETLSPSKILSPRGRGEDWGAA